MLSLHLLSTSLFPNASPHDPLALLLSFLSSAPGTTFPIFLIVLLLILILLIVLLLSLHTIHSILAGHDCLVSRLMADGMR